MGNLISRTRLTLGSIFYLNQALDILLKRLRKSPGIPIPNSSQPFWTEPKANITSEGKSLPVYADLVIIGSGITGASVAYNVLKRESSLRIVILEAREVCSGGTGRNGGHINPPLYHDYQELKEKHGERVAKMVIRFRLAHMKELMGIAIAEDILLESQCREVENFDVHMSKNSFAEAKRHLEAWKTDMPDESVHFHSEEGVGAIQHYHLSPQTVGFIHGDGGAMHPYRFVTSLFMKLLRRNPDNFFIATHTPCTAIAPPSRSKHYYTLITPRGTVKTPHVIHATNGWVSHLVEPMRAKIVPTRGTMTAQRPGTSLFQSTLNGLRSFIFYHGSIGYDYLTQLPVGEHELMFGGGWASAMDAALADIGISDDSQYSLPGASHLSGSLPLYFGIENWGKEKHAVQNDEDEAQWGEGRMKAQWSGILGFSSDGLPWVGRLPAKVSGRTEPPTTSTPRVRFQYSKDDPTESVRRLTAAPGEWISAGYTGEGMVHAWMCGKALSHMILDAEDEIKDWFPEIMRVTEQRWKRADPSDLLARFL